MDIQAFLDKAQDYLSAPWVGSLIGVFGIASGFFVAWIFYRRSLQPGKMLYALKEERVLGGGLQELPAGVRILFNDRDIRALYRTRVIFFNGGFRTLKGSEIVLIDPVRIVISEPADILEVRITNITRAVLQATAQVDSENHQCVKIGFDFMDPRDGFAVDIMHTEAAQKATAHGTIQGLHRGLELWPEFDTPTPVMNWLVGPICLGISLFGLFNVVPDLIGNYEKAQYLLVGLLAFLTLMFLVLALAGTVLTLARRKFPKALLGIQKALKDKT